MIKKVLLLNIIIMVALVLIGCWNARELNALGIALIMGLDFENDKVLLTAEVIEPVPAREKSSMGKGTTVTYVQGIGDNLFDAFRDITLKFDRKLYIAHNKVIIFGEEFAKKSSINDIDLLVRDHEQRETAYLLIAKDSKAYEVMGIAAGLEEIPGNYVLELVENFKYNPKAINIKLAEYLKYFYDMGRQPVLGIIEKKEKKQINKIEKPSSNKEYQLSIVGAAAFNKEELVGYLNGVETKGFNFIMGRVKTGIVTFPTPNTSVDGSSTPTPSVESDISLKRPTKIHMSTMDIVKLKTKKDVEIIDNNIILKVKVKLRCSLEEVAGDIDISKEENIKEVEKACSEEIKRGVGNTLLKAQKEFKSDIFGFGSVFHRKYPKEWEKIKGNWNDIFAEADFQIEVKTDVIRTGLINTPISRVKGK
ncbi:MAG: Ger(x)C family spore germination protein [Tissierellia bacterium]|nr:Ger(x)C family spore germination protein [Tissierellia bacterium]